MDVAAGAATEGSSRAWERSGEGVERRGAGAARPSAALPFRCHALSKARPAHVSPSLADGKKGDKQGWK